MTSHSMRPLTGRNTHVVVIGGGYAGTLAANRLRSNPGVDVSLINPRAAFVERIRLHQMVVGSGSATVDLTDMLDPSVRLIVDTAVQIDARLHTVLLGSGTSV